MTASAAMRARFVTDGAAGSSPQVLLVQLYERLVLDLVRAEFAVREQDRQAAHDQLIHAQAIVTALMVALDGAKWEATSRLQGLYRFLLTEMVQANVHQDADRVAACRALVEPLRDTWREAAVMVANALPSAVSAEATA